MTIQLHLPKDVEERLLEEVRQGRHASIENAILERLSQPDESEILSGIGMTQEQLRKDLNEAWDNREGKVSGEAVFERLRPSQQKSGY